MSEIAKKIPDHMYSKILQDDTWKKKGNTQMDKPRNISALIPDATTTYANAASHKKKQTLGKQTQDLKQSKLPSCEYTNDNDSLTKLSALNLDKNDRVAELSLQLQEHKLDTKTRSARLETHIDTRLTEFAHEQRSITNDQIHKVMAEYETRHEHRLEAIAKTNILALNQVLNSVSAVSETIKRMQENKGQK
jgi:hypothetical protein